MPVAATAPSTLTRLAPVQRVPVERVPHRLCGVQAGREPGAGRRHGLPLRRRRAQPPAGRLVEDRHRQVAAFGRRERRVLEHAARLGRGETARDAFDRPGGEGTARGGEKPVRKLPHPRHEGGPLADGRVAEEHRVAAVAREDVPEPPVAHQRAGRQRVEQVVGLRDGLGVDAREAAQALGDEVRADGDGGVVRADVVHDGGDVRLVVALVLELERERVHLVAEPGEERGDERRVEAPEHHRVGVLTRSLRFHDLQEELEQLVGGAILVERCERLRSRRGRWFGDRPRRPAERRSGPEHAYALEHGAAVGDEGVRQEKVLVAAVEGGRFGPGRFRRRGVGRRHEPLSRRRHEPPVRAGPRRKEDLAFLRVDDRGDDVGVGAVEEPVAMLAVAFEQRVGRARGAARDATEPGSVRGEGAAPGPRVGGDEIAAAEAGEADVAAGWRALPELHPADLRDGSGQTLMGSLIPGGDDEAVRRVHSA